MKIPAQVGTLRADKANTGTSRAKRNPISRSESLHTVARSNALCVTAQIALDRPVRGACHEYLDRYWN
jgi:hypothetical protein